MNLCDNPLDDSAIGWWVNAGPPSFLALGITDRDDADKTLNQYGLFLQSVRIILCFGTDYLSNYLRRIIKSRRKIIKPRRKIYIPRRGF